jgi:hypothetical protein
MIEPLESRIAPALVPALNGLSATYTDVDGDLVTIKFSKPISNDIGYGIVALGPFAESQQLQLLDFSALPVDATAGVNITITAKQQDADGDGFKDGDGKVNVGEIRSQFGNLGTVSIAGDLARIIARTNDPAIPALKSLTVQSMGEFGLETGALG